MAPRGVLRWSKREFVKQIQRSYSDDNWYRVPVTGVVDIDAIQKALNDRFKPQSGYGQLRWQAIAPRVYPEFGPFLPGQCSVMVLESISICD